VGKRRGIARTKENPMRKLIVLLLLAVIAWAPAQTLTTAIGSNPPTLDPQVTFNGFSFHVTNQIYETLVRVTPDGEVVAGLATSWTYPDPNTLRLTLRQGVSFHDGGIFDAPAAKASFERILDTSLTAPGRFVLSAITEVRAVDLYTLELVTNRPFAPLLAHLAHPVAAIVPVGQADAIARTPVGTGPYTFERWVDGSEVVLNANPNYWGGKPAIERVVVRIIPEVSTQIVELRSGGVDMIFNLPADNFLALASDSSVVTGSLPGWGSAHLGMNITNPKLADLRVRQAIAHAIDKALITEEFFRGLATPGVAPIPGTVLYSADLEEPYVYNVEGAKALLAEAGVSNLSLRLDVFTNPDLQSVAQVLQFALAEVGINLEIRVQDFSAWTQTVESDAAELYLSSWGTVTLDADYTLYAFFHSSQIPANNRSRWSDAGIDALLQAGRDNPDPAARAAAYLEVQQQAVQALPMVTLYYPLFTYAKRGNVEGEVLAFSWILLDLRNATID
jgi:peptide/nickel transport system substrate-binding protein